MIYQHNDTFGAFTHSAIYDGQTIYGNSPEEIHDYIQMAHDSKYIQNEFNGTLPPLVMPEVSSISLTPEQQARFDEVSAIQNITLDDVSGYTFDARQGVSVAYKLFSQQQELIGQGQMITDLELAGIENGQAMTDLELALYAAKGGIDGV